MPTNYNITIDNFQELFINDSLLSTNYTYSSSKINDLLNNLNISCTNCTGGSNYTLPKNILVDAVQFNQTPYITCANATTGQMFYDIDEKSLSYKVNGICLQIGEELYIAGTNKLGYTINNGQAVYINGVQGSKTTIGLTNALYENTSYVLGIATQDVLNNGEGKITTYGLVHDLDTSAWIEGTILYISTQNGNLTNIKPKPPLHSAKVGIVLRQHANQGKILVQIANGFELDELHDVYLNMSSIPINSVLKWNGTVWIAGTDNTGGGGGSTYNNYYSNITINNTIAVNESFINYNGTQLSSYTNILVNGQVINTTIYYNGSQMLYAIQNNSGIIRYINLSYTSINNNSKITRVTY